MQGEKIQAVFPFRHLYPRVYEPVEYAAWECSTVTLGFPDSISQFLFRRIQGPTKTFAPREEATKASGRSHMGAGTGVGSVAEL